MTTRSTFEHDLPAILEDLYLGPTPNYRDEALAVVFRTRQRQAWAFAGRWIPMADIASRPALVPRVPWRAVGLALLIVALVLVTAFVVGSRQTRVPPPFGLADNGLITYASGGDIFTLDPVTGVSTLLVAGPETDSTPMFSPDGRGADSRGWRGLGGRGLRPGLVAGRPPALRQAH